MEEEQTVRKVSQGQVARNFQKNAIVPSLQTVPGVGPAMEKKFRVNNINTTSQLVGQFFLMERDEVRFIEWLEDLGMMSVYAAVCAEAMTRKFATL